MSGTLLERMTSPLGLETLLATLMTSPLLQFGGVITGVLVAGATVLSSLRLSSQWSRPGVRKAWVAFRSWLVMAPLILLSLALGRSASIVALGPRLSSTARPLLPAASSSR